MDATESAKRVTGRLRAFISLVVLLVVAAICFRLLAPDTVGEHARRQFLQVLSQHYSDFDVTVRSGRYDPQVGLIFTDVELRQRDLPPGGLPTAIIERMLVETHIDLGGPKRGTPIVRANRILISGATVNAWQRGDGSWSPEALFPAPQVGPACPIVVADGIRVRLCRGNQSGHAAIELNDIKATLRQQTVPEGETEMNFLIEGGGGFLESLRVVGHRGPDGKMEVAGRITNINFDNRVYQRLPDSIRQRLSDLAQLSAVANVDWRVRGTSIDPFQHWQANIQVTAGRFAHPRLPVAIERIGGRFVVSPQGAHILGSEFYINESKCQVSGSLAGLTWPCPVDIKVRADQLNLDESLLSVLPEKPREVSDQIRPRGIVDLDGRIRGMGDQWICDGEVVCHDVAVNIDKFPYPVTGVRGIVRYVDKVTTATDLICQVGDAPVVSSFQLAPPESDVPHWINLKSKRPLRIDDALISALTPRGDTERGLETFVRSLSPGGSVRVLGATFQRTPSGETSKSIDLEVLDGRLRYDAFSYPLYEVRGRIRVDDDQVRLSQFQAQNNGGAQIQCEGTWRPIPGQRGGNLDLTFRAYSILLDDGLRAALPTTAQQTWDTLSPAGVLESLEVRVLHNPSLASPQLAITARQWGNTSSARRELSVTPIALPYRLDIDRGIVRMEGERIVITELDGFHGSSRLSAEGQCIRREDGRWQLDLNVLTGSRLRPDNELIGSLPTEIRGSFAKLQLREPVSLRGTTQLILPDQQHPNPVFSWNVLLQLEGNRIGDAGPVNDIRGEIAVSGSASGEMAAADGSVRIDSMHVNGLQITDIRGPFLIRGSRLRLGMPADQNDGPGTPIQGRLFDGTVRLEGGVLLSSGAYDVNVALERADVSTLLTEMDQNQAGLTGLFGGKVNLEGNLGASHLLRGTGKAALTDANIYQLPLIVQLFNQLRLTPAEDVAFTDGTADFTIDGDLLTLTDLNLWGDLVALSGGGTINGRHELDLAFNTRVSPQNAWSRLVRPLSSSQYTLWTLNVSGPLSDPQIERRALDAVGETLERLFPVMDRRTSDLPLATGESVPSAASQRRPAGPRAGGSPWLR
jgi:hypothetical protein